MEDLLFVENLGDFVVFVVRVVFFLVLLRRLVDWGW